MISLFNSLIFQPLYNALVFLYVIIPDIGIAIILLTVVIRLLLLPLSKKSIESQKKMQEIQPEIKKLQKKYQHDKQLQGQKMMELYKQKKINPASGCFPIIIQLIFLIALYQVFMEGLGGNGKMAELLYDFMKNPGELNPIAFGFLDLSVANIPMAIVAAALQFVQGKMMIAKSEKQKQETKPQKKDNKPDEPDFATIMQQQMLYLGPIMTLIIGFKFAAGLILYWIITTIFMIVQQYMVLHKEKKAV